MKVLRGTLTFILGLVMGIVLLIVATVGVVVGVGTMVKVKDLPVNLDKVIGEDSDLYGQTILEAAKGLINDLHNFDRLSMKDLYDHYGISFFKGMSGLDFTQKAFYTMPISDVAKDWSIIVDSLTLSDIDTVAKLDLAKHNRPIIDENMNVGLSTALDNILNTFNGGLSMRLIKDKFGIDLGVDQNDMLKSLQDIGLSEFGGTINAMRLNTLLDADTDTYVLRGLQDVYVKVDEYQAVPASDLKKTAAADGVETYIAGAYDSDEDGTDDKLDVRELRYVKKTVDGADAYVVDNSCYNEDASDSVTYYRHLTYKKATTTASEYFVLGYANRLDVLSPAPLLLTKEFVSLKNLYDDAHTSYNSKVTSGHKVNLDKLSVHEDEKDVESAYYELTDMPLSKDSVLNEVEAPTAEGKTYLRAHVGTAEAAIQSIAYLTVSELKDAGDILGNRKIKELITIDDDTSKILVSLQDCTLSNIASEIDKLSFDSMVDITCYDYTPNDNGKFVLVETESGSYYTIYNAAVHEGLQRYDREDPDGEVSSLVLQRLAGANLKELDKSLKEITLADVLDIDPDVYVKLDYSGEEIQQYITEGSDLRVYYFDSEKKIYKLASKDYVESNSEVPFFKIQTVGSDHSVIKKLAFVGIEGMAGVFDDIMNETFLSELIDIVTANGVKLSESAVTSQPEGKYFIEWDDLVDENGNKYVYVYDGNGSYFLSDFLYVEVDRETEPSPVEIKFNYKPVKEYTQYDSQKAQVLAKLAASGNIYYHDPDNDANDPDTYLHNVQLCTYLIGRISAGQPEEVAAAESKLYYREQNGSGQFSGKYYNPSAEQMYVEFVGNMVDITTVPTIPGGVPGVGGDLSEDWHLAICTEPLYKKQTGGQYFVKMGDSKYPYSGGNTFAKLYCETVYVEDVSGNYVFVDGNYIEDVDHAYTDVPRYTAKEGVIAEHGQVYLSDGSTKLDTTKIKNVEELTHEKSSIILTYLADATVNGLNDKISEAKLENLIEIEPDSIFERIKDRQLTDLGPAINEMLSDMTISDILALCQVEGVPSSVVQAIEGATIKDFFASLKYDQKTGMIFVDIEALVTSKSTKA